MNLKTTRELRQKILEVSHQAKAGHVASSFSILETLYVLYSSILKEEDSFILSKGHGSLGLYSVLWMMGKISDEEFSSFCKYDSKLGGHPDRNKIPGVVASTGSLGHGLPIAVGIAYAKKLQNESGKVYCLVGDGECNEGTIWESALLASHLKLNNLICIVDNNNSQIRSVPSGNVLNKFESFGFQTTQVFEGNNIEKVKDTLERLMQNSPQCVVMNTVKGFGVNQIESDMFEWHHKHPSAEQLQNFKNELNQ